MEGEQDPFDYVLAERLGMTVTDMRNRMPNTEYIEWRAFYNWRAAQQELERKKAAARRGNR